MANPWALIITVVAVLAALVAMALRSRRWLPTRTKRQAAVHLSDGTSLSGVLWEVCPDVLVLRHARVLSASEHQNPPADGDVAVPRDRVVWLQILGVGGDL